MIDVGCVTIPRILGGNKHSGALEGLGRDKSNDGFLMSDHEVEPLLDGLKGLASRRLGWFWIDVFYEIPNSCLEYGTRVNG